VHETVEPGLLPRVSLARAVPSSCCASSQRSKRRRRQAAPRFKASNRPVKPLSEMIWRACCRSARIVRPAEDRQCDGMEGSTAACEEREYREVAKSLGIGTGTFQRIANELW
jgi:hypothetical protein